MKNITRIILFTGLISTNLIAYAQNTELKGNVKGLGNTDVTFYYTQNGQQKADKVKAIEGKFNWTAPMTKMERVMVMFPRRGIYFFAESGKMAINGSMDSLDHLKITGTKVQAEFNVYNEQLQDFMAKDTTGSGIKTLAGNSENYARDRINKAKKRKFDDQYIQKQPESMVSLYMLKDRAVIGSYDDVLSGYDKLGSTPKLTPEGMELTKRLEILKRKRIGEQVMDFTLPNLVGKTVNVSDFKGQYVLIDFWASWCSPCRAENPNIVKAYHAYKEQKFNVIGITIDENLDKWRQAVKEDGTPWTQLADLKDPVKSVADYYGILGVPSSLLIDPNGKIIAIDVRGESLKKKLTELFGAPKI
ncbi:MAG: AhpC/TSA family protein [Pedobacter sp.]|nr:MAG: AhpC/TSA family protein [Pedobacter sp.]